VSCQDFRESEGQDEGLQAGQPGLESFKIIISIYTISIKTMKT
jgi:hypothetical protein